MSKASTALFGEIVKAIDATWDADLYRGAVTSSDIASAVLAALAAAPQPSASDAKVQILRSGIRAAIEKLWLLDNPGIDDELAATLAEADAVHDG